MNATEKAKALAANGYTYMGKVGIYHQWRKNMQLISYDTNYNKATSDAYKHFSSVSYDWREDMGYDDLATNHNAIAQHYLDNQAPTESPASEAPTAPQVEAPKFKVGDKVTVKALLPKVYTILLIDPLAANPYLLNTDGGYWYTEDSLSAAPVADAPQVDERPNVVSGDFVLLDILPDMMQEKNERIAKLEADNAALRNENARMKESIAHVRHSLEIAIENAEDTALHTDSGNIYSQAKGKESALRGILFTLNYSLNNKAQDTTSTPPAQEAPKRPVATRCRVNWNGRGFSSGSYEVLGYSQNKQVYVLNISSDADKPMPKMVKMADCAALS